MNKLDPHHNQCKAHAARKHGKPHTGAPIIHHEKIDISQHTLNVLHSIAIAAGVSEITVTSAFRSAGKQAGEWFKKHVHGKAKENYKSAEAMHIIADTRDKFRHHEMSKDEAVHHMTNRITNAKGGPGSISHHLEKLPWREVVDIGGFATDAKREAFIIACRAKMPVIITAMGHA